MKNHVWKVRLVCDFRSLSAEFSVVAEEAFAASRAAFLALKNGLSYDDDDTWVVVSVERIISDVHLESDYAD